MLSDKSSAERNVGQVPSGHQHFHRPRTFLLVCETL